MLSNAIRDVVSAAEWQVRTDLAAFYRIISLLELTDLIYSHITARVPGTANELLITPLGLDPSEITASNLTKVDCDGNVLLPSPTGLSIDPVGFLLHGAVYAARPDLTCIAHTHSYAGAAVSSLECGLLPINQNAMRFLGDLAYHEYEGVTSDAAEGARLASQLGNCHVMIMRNHGLLACGRSVAHAYLNLHSLEIACSMQVQTLACGKPLHMPSKEALEISQSVYAHLRQLKPTGNYPGPEMEWSAAKRKLDKVTTDYMN